MASKITSSSLVIMVAYTYLSLLLSEVTNVVSFHVLPYNSLIVVETSPSNL